VSKGVEVPDSCSLAVGVSGAVDVSLIDERPVVPEKRVFFRRVRAPEIDREVLLHRLRQRRAALHGSD
jgi:hypothetical protein